MSTVLVVLLVAMMPVFAVVALWDRLRRGRGSDVDVASCLANLDRLNAVTASGLMDGPLRPDLDLLTLEAATTLGAPMSVMSVMDDRRQFFASQYGLDEDLAAARGTPASESYCQYVVAFDKALRVDDARRHPLVNHHPATLAGTRSYLGVPLRTEAGHTIGSFCVVATAARHWTTEDRSTLEGIAARAMTSVSDGSWQTVSLDRKSRNGQ